MNYTILTGSLRPALICMSVGIQSNAADVITYTNASIDLAATEFLYSKTSSSAIADTAGVTYLLSACLAYPIGIVRHNLPICKTCR